MQFDVFFFGIESEKPIDKLMKSFERSVFASNTTNLYYLPKNQQFYLH